VRIELEDGVQDGCAGITITVRDFGAGIPAENLGQVFEPFFTTGRGEGGSVLGLSIVRNLVVGPLGGAVSIESRPGAGTAVRVGTSRFVLDHDRPGDGPFADIFRRPRKFAFFVPTAADLDYPMGVLLNSGRGTLSDERVAIQFATSSFTSGKATPIVGMPEINPLFVSPLLAKRTGLRPGDDAIVTNCHSGGSVVLPVMISAPAARSCCR
jgi:hypothetical protein